MANPIQQGLKQAGAEAELMAVKAAMANPIQQGLKHLVLFRPLAALAVPQWLIQYNKD